MANSRLKSVLKLIDAVKEEIPVEQSFLNDLCRSIEMDAKASQRLPSKTYKPSSMNCIRNMFYQVTGHPQDESETSYALVGICNSGTDIHKRVQDAVLQMKKYGMDCEYINVADFVRTRNLEYLTIVSEPNPTVGDYETKLYHNNLKLSFLCDGIIKYKDKYYILELKTESAYKWQSRTGVDPKHFAQGTSYSIAFNIPNVIFVYISRDVLSMKSYMFTPTDEMKEELLGKISECDNYVKKNTLPPIPENISKSVCEYCNYRASCKGDI